MAASELENCNFNLGFFCFFFILFAKGEPESSDTGVGFSAYIGVGPKSRAYRNNQAHWWKCSFPFEVHPTDGLIPQPEVGSALRVWQAGAEVVGGCSLQKMMGRGYA